MSPPSQLEIDLQEILDRHKDQPFKIIEAFTAALIHLANDEKLTGTIILAASVVQFRLIHRIDDTIGGLTLLETFTRQLNPDSALGGEDPEA